MSGRLGFRSFPVITIADLQLSPLTREDLPQLLALRSAGESAPWLDRPPVRTLADVQEFYGKVRQREERREWLFWAVRNRPQGTFLGTLCLWNVSSDGREAEVGYELLPAQRGRGVMSRALCAVLSYAGSSLGLLRVTAVVHPDNLASIRLLQRQGFIPTGEQLASSSGETQLSMYALRLGGGGASWGTP